MPTTPPSGHEPVMLPEVLAHLRPEPGMTIIDCTLGRAGHALALARILGPTGTLVGLDSDPRNLEFAAAALTQAECKTRLFHANFAQLPQVLAELGDFRVQGILADLGVSTNQLFDPAYGMSFETSMPLDMRLDPEQETSAADLVNNLSETALANVLYELAQERYSRRIARKIVEARRISPIKTTEALAELVRGAMPRRRGAARRSAARSAGRRTDRPRIDEATRTFLALRMAVNREMQSLLALLDAGPKALDKGARMLVIAFQSMEDRMVKQAFGSLERTGLVTQITKKPLSPTPQEIARNPRARSAKLRVVQRT